MHRPSCKQQGAGLALVLLLLAPSTGAINYHPLDLGTEWHYANEIGQAQSRVMTGQLTVLGVETVVRHEEITEGDEVVDIFESFWTCDDGDLYLHGAVNLMDPFEAAYVPPIMILDAPLELGNTWSTEGVQWCLLDGTNCTEGVDYHWMVYTEGYVSVPAGLFYAYGIGQYLPPFPLRAPSGERFNLFGRHIRDEVAAAHRDATEWYSENVGGVQHGSYTWPEYTMRLITWQPVPVEHRDWGRIKALFR